MINSSFLEHSQEGKKCYAVEHDERFFSQPSWHILNLQDNAAEFCHIAGTPLSRTALLRPHHSCQPGFSIEDYQPDGGAQPAILNFTRLFESRPPQGVTEDVLPRENG